jgi:quinone-modifying oxidoreductase, subunit QmoB
MADEKKCCIYLQGLRIGERLDTGRAGQGRHQVDGKMPIVREHDFLCSAEGVAMIKNDIDNEGVTHAMIVRLLAPRQDRGVQLPHHRGERANLREGVIWIRPDTDEARETTQEMAEDYVRMACAEVKAMTVPRATRRPAR